MMDVDISLYDVGRGKEHEYMSLESIACGSWVKS